MKEVVEAIKKSATEAIEASKPVAVLYGTIDTIEPLTIKINQETSPLKESELIFTTVTKKTFVEEDIGKGFILLRVQGGQRFIVLDWL